MSQTYTRSGKKVEAGYCPHGGNGDCGQYNPHVGYETEEYCVTKVLDTVDPKMYSSKVDVDADVEVKNTAGIAGINARGVRSEVRTDDEPRSSDIGAIQECCIFPDGTKKVLRTFSVMTVTRPTQNGIQTDNGYICQWCNSLFFVTEFTPQ